MAGQRRAAWADDAGEVHAHLWDRTGDCAAHCVEAAMFGMLAAQKEPGIGPGLARGYLKLLQVAPQVLRGAEAGGRRQGPREAAAALGAPRLAMFMP